MTGLPSFHNPPVTEVVASVSFKQVPGLSSVALARFWEHHLADDFPRIEEQPPYEPPIERFGSPAPMGLPFQLETGFPSPRLWFLTDDGSELLQCQRNWFACNWRKVHPDDQYARWPSRRAAFANWYGRLLEFLDSEGLDKPAPTQCEVTYINHIVAGDGWRSHAELHRVLRIVAPATDGSPPQEQTTIATQFLLNRGDVTVGRLHVRAQPAFRREDDAPVVVLELTARGLPSTPSIDGVLEFLDLGRDAIVRTFAAITTDEMQEEWGRYE